MRVVISDYSGHPFQVQLSRELARRGHRVLHIFSAAFQTPKGNLVRQPDDPDTFEIRGLTLQKPFQKDSFARRRGQEIEFGHLLANEVARFKPDVVISSNAPLDTQRLLQKATGRQGARFIFWLQDIYSRAIAEIVPRKFPLIGHLVAGYYTGLEFRMLRASQHVVAITDDFVPILTRCGIPAASVSVIENWAPLDELPLHDRDNDWARAHMSGDGGSGDALRIVYSGTLGYKHDPNILATVAERFPDTSVYVFSEGAAAGMLAGKAAQNGIRNLHVRPWVPFADLPRMLSGADLFVAMVEKEAGTYSVPSKILTYLAIGRPILASVPGVNLAAKLLERHSAGMVAEAGDTGTMLAHLARLVVDKALRDEMGANGRAYAASKFDIATIADQFEQLLEPGRS